MALPEKPKILYSTNTYISYRISEKYYEGKHYVYCSSKAGCESLSDRIIDNPPTSCPMYRYKQLKEESQTGELHGLIKEQKSGLRKGVIEKYKKGIITSKQKKDLLYIIEHSQNTDFKPLLYLIPYENVKELLKEVKVEDKAHPLSEEYIIEELPSDYFEILDLNDL